MPPINLADNASLSLIENNQTPHPLFIDARGMITQAQFLHDLQQTVGQLPEHPYVFNLCQDRYLFMLGFCASLLRQQVTLLPPNQRHATLRDIAQQYPGSYCLTDTESECPLPQTIMHQPLGSRATPPQELTLPQLPIQQLAAIAFTSGSTGIPSGHRKHWGTLVGTARLLSQRFQDEIKPGPILATVPSQHMYGLEMTLMMALQGQRTLLRATPFFPADIGRLMANQPQPVTLVSTPPHLRSLVQEGLELPRAASLVSATAPLHRSLAQAAAQVFQTPLREIYGCTEAGSMATRDPLADEHWHLLDGFTLEESSAGFSARAPHLADSPLLQDQLTLLPNRRHFSLLGRHSDMINVGGKRESLANLTLKLLQIPGVEDGVVFLPRGAQNTSQRPAAMVVTQRPERALITELCALLDPVFVPRPLRKVDSLPRNDTGKLTLSALHALWDRIHDQ